MIMENYEEAKPSQGRRRKELKKIISKTALEVTFSKRHKGLFNKAAELSILCGAEVAVITYSPHGNPFVFGHPSAEVVLDRYIGRVPGYDALQDVDINHILHCHKNHYNHALRELEETKRIGEEIGRSGSSGTYWWEIPIEGLGIEELERFIGCMEKLKEKVIDKIEKMKV